MRYDIFIFCPLILLLSGCGSDKKTAGGAAVPEAVKEMMAEPTRKIGRPRQLYRGEPARPFVPVDQRQRG